MDNSFASKIIECFGEDYFNKIWNSDNIIDPWKISWKANRKALFNCGHNDNHTFYRMIYKYWETQECPICKKENNSVGIKYPDSYLYWSELNDTTPLDHSSMCGDLVYWKCNNNVHDDYLRTIKNSVFSVRSSFGIRTAWLLPL